MKQSPTADAVKTIAKRPGCEVLFVFIWCGFVDRFLTKQKHTIHEATLNYTNLFLVNSEALLMTLETHLHGHVTGVAIRRRDAIIPQLKINTTRIWALVQPVPESEFFDCSLYAI